jgi:CBS domain-containing protein
MMLGSVISLLKQKEKARLLSIAPAASVADAVRLMSQENVGSVLVLEGQKLVGIFTERDVMTRVVGADRDPAATPVSDVMTREVRTIDPASTADDALRLMSDRRHRHLPVVEKGEVLGLISIGDVTRWYIRSQQEQVDTALRAVKQMAMSNRRG